jgi:polyhydroxyalkanoate synthesis regulator phasin
VSGSANSAPEPPRLSARYGAFGGLAKRVVERLIRFYTYRQETVNRDVDERLRELEQIPVTRRGGELNLRAQVSALSARLTHLQRETAHLRERLERLENTPE